MAAAALVTGAAGFIGAHLVRELQAQGRCEVVALDDLSGGFRENLPEDVEFVEGSVTNAKLMKEIFGHYQFQYVYHLGAYAAEGLSHFIRRFNYTNNLIGSVTLVNEAVKHDVRCFVFTSSIAVYGEGQVPLREDTSPRPEDPYGVAKYAVEMDLRAANSMFGLNHVVFRPHNVYGEFQNIADKYRNVVGIFMNQILRDEPMTIFGDGEQERAFSYVGDIVGVIAKAPWVEAARNQVFNIGADKAYKVNELARQVAFAMGVPGHATKHLDPRNEVKVAYSDHTAVRRVFGPMRQTTLEEGLGRMAEWVKRVGARQGEAFEDIEIRRNLPPSWNVGKNA